MAKWLKWSGCLALVLVPLIARADVGGEDTGSIYISGNVGLDLATFGGAGAENGMFEYSRKRGFSISGAVGMDLGDYVVAQVGLAYTRNGSRVAEDGALVEKVHLSYLELPLLIQIALSKSAFIQPHVDLGPSLGILTTAKGEAPDGSTYPYWMDLMNRFDIGVMLGAGVAVNQGPKRALTFDIRYDRGLSGIYKTLNTSEYELNNRTIYFLIGYRADLRMPASGHSGP